MPFHTEKLHQPIRGYNKAVGGYPYCVGWHPYCAGGPNKDIHAQEGETIHPLPSAPIFEPFSERKSKNIIDYN